MFTYQRSINAQHKSSTKILTKKNVKDTLINTSSINKTKKKVRKLSQGTTHLFTGKICDQKQQINNPSKCRVDCIKFTSFTSISYYSFFSFIYIYFGALTFLYILDEISFKIINNNEIVRINKN